ncbi:MAG TPA: DIP1984 family protein [Aggregatilineaceae bacterium]|nr:DIP1984 family protein [Aggregatilineaceae bacterium]
MKLAEALVLRADYQKRIDQLKQRLVMVARVQEGERPAEDPQALLAELDRVVDELTRLIQRINRTNAATELDPGLTLSDALAVRDTLGLRYSAYRELAQRATITQDRYTRSEVRFQSAVNVADLQQRADQFAQQRRDLDTRIQAANWTVDVIE